MAKNDVSADSVRASVSYDKETGLFHWIATLGARAMAGRQAGFKEAQGYVCININRTAYKAHRLAWLLAYGDWPNGEVDHINGVRDDNRLCNLRVTTRFTNMQNQRTASRKNRTGLLGVSMRPKWFEARITVNHQHISIGKFDTAEEAHAAYIDAKRRLHVTCTL